MVMNVTDVDDKIIARARRNYLVAQYRALGQPAAEVRRARVESSASAHNSQPCPCCMATFMLCAA